MPLNKRVCSPVREDTMGGVESGSYSTILFEVPSFRKPVFSSFIVTKARALYVLHTTSLQSVDASPLP